MNQAAVPRTLTTPSARPRPVPTSAIVGERLGMRSFVTWLIAGYFFYLPLGNVPIMKVIRNEVLNIPVLGVSGDRAGVSLSLLFFPDMLFALFLLGAAALSKRSGRPGPRRASSRALWVMIVLTLAGGIPAAVGSEFPGVATTGVIARLAVLLVGLVIVWRRPTPEVVRLWAVAGLLGTAIIMAIGVFVYLQTFGLPETLFDLPNRRAFLKWLPYQRVTYGHAANTAGLLVMTIPVAIVLLLSRGLAWPLRLALAASLGLFGVNLLFAFQRWAFVCFVLSVVAIVAYWRTARQGLVMLVVSALLYALIGRVIIDELGGYFADAVTGSGEATLNGRLGIWQGGIEQILLVPGGVGYGTVNSLTLGGFGSAHSMLLDTTIEAGLLGGVGFLFWCVVVFSNLVSAFFRRRERTGDLSFGLLLSAATFLLYGAFFNGQMYLAGIIVWYGFMMLFPIMAMTLHEDALEEARENAMQTPTPAAPISPAARPAVPAPARTRAMRA